MTLKWRGQRSLETQPATRVERIFSHSLTSRLFPFGFVYRLLLGFYRVFPISCRVSTGFLRFYGKLMAGISPFFLSASRCPVEFTEFYRVLPSFTEFPRPGLIRDLNETDPNIGLEGNEIRSLYLRVYFVHFFFIYLFLPSFSSHFQLTDRTARMRPTLMDGGRDASTTKTGSRSFQQFRPWNVRCQRFAADYL